MKTKSFFIGAIKKLFFLGLSLIVVSIVMDYYRKPSEPVQFTNQVLTDTQNQPKIIAQISHQKPMLLYFWGSWCHYCQFTSPSVQQLHDEGVEVVGVAIKSGDAAEVNRYLSKNGYTFSTISDQTGEFYQPWGISATPTIVIIKDGQVKNHTTGLTSYWGIKTRLWFANFL